MPFIAYLLAHQAELLIDRGLYEEAIAAATSAIALPQANHDPVAEAMGCRPRGVALHRQSAYGASDEKLTQALQIALRASSPQLQADAHLSMGRNRFYQGDYTGGQIYHEQVIAHYRSAHTSAGAISGAGARRLGPT
jgi:tetratricopeptide (TPR) repeat protein